MAGLLDTKRSSQGAPPAGRSGTGMRRLSLRARLLAILAIALICMWLSTYVAASTILLGGFAKLESDDTTEHVGQALEALSATVTQLANNAGDWANWTETYNFIEGGNPNFVKANLESVSTFIQLKLSMMIFVHRSGRRVLTRAFDPARQHYVPPSKALLGLVTPSSVLIRHARSDSRVSGVVILPEGPLLVGSRPILTTEMTGPIRGTVIFGRYLDQKEIERLAAQVRLKLDIREFNASSLPADFVSAREAIGRETKYVVRPLDRDSIAGYASVADVYGQPALIVRVVMPRVIFAQGKATSLYFVLALMGVGLVLGIVLVSVFEKLILSRFARQQTEKRYRAVVEQTSDGIVLVDGESMKILEGNRAGQQMLGLDAAGLKSKTLPELLPDLYKIMAGMGDTGSAPGQGASGEIRYRRTDGAEVELEVSADKIFNEGRNLFVLDLRDVTGRKAAERALRTSEERYALAARGANDGLWDWNLVTQHVYFSPRWKAMLGLADDEVEPGLEGWLSRTSAEDRTQLTQTLLRHIGGDSPHFECEFRILHNDGTYRWMLSRGLAVRDEGGIASRLAGSMTDITARKKAEEQLLHDALHDGLTSLANRVLFADRLNQVILRVKRAPEHRFGVLFIDVDRFKVVNDSLGHLTGDELLVAIGRRLSGAVREGDTVARFGGDEFAILLEDIHVDDDVARVVERVQRSLNAPFDPNGHQTFVTVSIGSVSGGQDYSRSEDVLRDADTALYRAKALGRDRHVVFDHSMHERAVLLLRLETDLRRALDRDELVLHYQPIVSLATEAILGFEALVRWQHPDRGSISPAEFIPLAEETGLIIPIGHRLLEQACSQIHDWTERFPADPPLWISVNISPKQFARDELVDEVAALMTARQIAPRSLKFEITETAVMENLDSACAIIHRLKALGVQIALDDFGTGYSSLNALHRLPIDMLKIDRAFVRRMAIEGEEDPAIVSSIVSMAQALDITVVAEGIETPDQAARLRALGCEYGQGYLFARPQEARQAAGLLETQHGHKRGLAHILGGRGSMGRLR